MSIPIISKVANYISNGEVYHAKFEFPATLVPLTPDVDLEDDDFIVMEILDGVARILYTDYVSEYSENVSNDTWILCDRSGRRVYNVHFHEVDDAEEWVRENLILRVMLSKKNPLGADALEELENLVSEFELFSYDREGITM